jgi:hypothetical protein
MIAQLQGFDTTNFDELTITQAEFEEYLSCKSEMDAPSNPLGKLYGATTRILRYAFWLANQKAVLAKSEFKKLLNLLGWKGEEKKYLKVAQAFADFEPHELAQVEPRTIFQLAENQKKYTNVISGLAQLPQITQDAVRKLIQQCRTPRQKQPKQEDKPSIWRRTQDGNRYCQIPPIHEQETGVTLQAMMDSEGASATSIVTEAIALRQSYIEGKLILNPDLAEEEITSETPIFDDEQEMETSVETSEIEALVPGDSEPDNVDNVSASTHEVETIPTIVTTQSQEVQSIPRWQLGWNVGDMVVANQKCQHFHEWCNESQVQIQSVTGKVGTIQFICVVRADGETYDTFGEWIEEIPSRQFQVGDKVIWTNCYAHLSSWQPFVITSIDGDKAKLDIYQHPVPLSELQIC